MRYLPKPKTLDGILAQPGQEQYVTSNQASQQQFDNVRHSAGYQRDPSVPRVNMNSPTNVSSEVWAFGGHFGYDQEAKRFSLDAAAEERAQRDAQRERKVRRLQFLRTYAGDRESARWDVINDKLHHDQDVRAVRQKNSLMGKNSVGYDIITMNYSGNAQGDRLATKDASAVERFKERGKRYFVLTNTYDPIKGIDVRETAEYRDVAARVLPPVYHKHESFSSQPRY